MKIISRRALIFICVGGFTSVVFWGTVMAGDAARTPVPSVQTQEQSLSDEQKARVASILSQYDSSSLTVEDAKAINNAFREAGIRKGPGQREAIEAAGFDARKISSLDPPPDRKRMDSQNSDRDK
jgi:hypothetical protein